MRFYIQYNGDQPFFLSSFFPISFFSVVFFFSCVFFFLLLIFFICLCLCKQYIVLFHSIIILKILFTFTMSFGCIVFFILKFLFMQMYIPYTHSDGINISSVKQMWLTKKLQYQAAFICIFGLMNSLVIILVVSNVCVTGDVRYD